MKEMDICDECIEFAVFCIESLAEHLHKQGDHVYKLLTEQTDILYDYIIPGYEILHTQDKGYIVNDLMEVLKKQGVAV